MTKDDIIRMAREANCAETFGTDTFLCTVIDLKRFVKRVVANIDPKSFMSWQEGYEAGVLAEREECAKLIEEYPYWLGTVAKQEIAAAIRARTTQ